MEKCRPGASRKVPRVSSSLDENKVFERPRPKLRVEAKSSLSERNYFITMHHQAGVFHWSSIPGHFANRDETPGQTFKPGRVVGPTLTKIWNLILNLTSGLFVKDHLLFLLFKYRNPRKVTPRGITLPPPWSGPCSRCSVNTWKCRKKSNVCSARAAFGRRTFACSRHEMEYY